MLVMYRRCFEHIEKYWNQLIGEMFEAQLISQFNMLDAGNKGHEQDLG